jgi:hypothetical protein
LFLKYDSIGSRCRAGIGSSSSFLISGGAGLSTQSSPLAHRGDRPATSLTSSSLPPSIAREELGQGVLRLALEHVVEVPAVEEDPLVDEACGPPMIVILPCSLAYLAQAMARRMFGVSALKPITSFCSMAAFISWSVPTRSSMQGDRDLLLLEAGAEVADAQDHRERVLLDVGLDVGQQRLAHGSGMWSRASL